MRSDFDHILVDEYQDTNRLQAAILLALAPDGAGLTVVGDGYRRSFVRLVSTRIVECPKRSPRDR